MSSTNWSESCTPRGQGSQHFYISRYGQSGHYNKTRSSLSRCNLHSQALHWLTGAASWVSNKKVTMGMKHKWTKWKRKGSSSQNWNQGLSVGKTRAQSTSLVSHGPQYSLTQIKNSALGEWPNLRPVSTSKPKISSVSLAYILCCFQTSEPWSFNYFGYEL